MSNMTATEIDVRFNEWNKQSGQWINYTDYLATFKCAVVGTEYHQEDTYSLLTKQEQEKEKTMTLDLQQADFFRDIIRTKKYEKLTELSKQFGLQNDDYPTTIQELVDRIAGGKFILNSETKDQRLYSKGDLIRNITWRDPAIKKDQAGYDAAEKTLDEAYLNAKMAIMTNPAQGADAVAKFATA